MLIKGSENEKVAIYTLVDQLPASNIRSNIKIAVKKINNNIIL